MYYIFNSSLVNNMNFDLSYEQFCQIVPQCKTPRIWYDNIMETLPTYKIDTELRFAAWMAQMMHESSQFNVLVENLNYSAQGLLKTFPTHFNTSSAPTCARNPEMIANTVYANRMGNGDYASGDGWKNRGRGIVQLTGHDNYALYSNDLYGDSTLLDNPDLALDPSVAVCIACQFWENHSLNALADAQDIKGITKKVNGGENGLQERTDNYNHCLDVLGV